MAGSTLVAVSTLVAGRHGNLCAVNCLRDALEHLAHLHPHLFDDARVAWQDLADSDSPEGLTQWRLQVYCWHILVHDPPDPARRWHRALALAALLDGLGLERYAAISRSETTREILLTGAGGAGAGGAGDAGGAGGAGGHALVRRAFQRSGIDPPDTELLTWGAVAAAAEQAAREAVADRLELAVAVGDLQPGSRGWRDQQADITIAVLTTPNQQGCEPYELILDERIEDWVRGPRSATRESLLAPLEHRLREPVGPGLAAPARDLLRPLDWLLREIGDGIMLTAAGYLPPRTVARAVDELGWREELGGPASREVDAYPMLSLRETATRLGLIRRRGPRLLLTPRGRAAAADGRALWLAVVSGIVGAEHSALAVAYEVVLAALEPARWIQADELRVMVQAVVTESGWRLSGRREPSGRDTSALFHGVVRELRWLELLDESGTVLDRRLCAHDGAGELFRAALRHRMLHRLVVPF